MSLTSTSVACARTPKKSREQYARSIDAAEVPAGRAELALQRLRRGVVVPQPCSEAWVATAAAPPDRLLADVGGTASRPGRRSSGARGTRALR